MTGFWAVTLFVLGLLFLYPGIFIWPFAILSTLMLIGGGVTALWDDENRQRPIALSFAWMSGFLALAEVAMHVMLRVVTD